MKIIKFKKMSGDKYKVLFENTEIVLYEDVILKHNLLSKKEIVLENLETIINDNKYYEAYNLSLKFLSIKMRSEKEVRNYLEKKDIVDDKIIDDIIDKLRENGFLNEKQYIEAFINDNINLKNNGPYKIKEELLKMDFDEGLIESYLKNISEDIWIQKIKKYIDKITSNSKNYSSNMLKQKILNDLYIKGYDKELIYPFLEDLKVDDNESLIKEYNKAYKRYSVKFKEEELNNKIVSYLLRKGYEYRNINELMK